MTPWTVAHQAPLSMEFSRQEFLSGFPFPFPGDLPDPEIKARYPALQEDSLPSEPPGELREIAVQSFGLQIQCSNVEGLKLCNIETHFKRPIFKNLQEPT